MRRGGKGKIAGNRGRLNVGRWVGKIVGMGFAQWIMGIAWCLLFMREQDEEAR